VTVAVWNSAHAAYLRVSTTELDGVPVLSAEGELDSWTADSPAWKAAVDGACGPTGPAVLVLDLQRLYFIDCAGLVALEQFTAGFESRGRRLLFAGVRPRIREFLRDSSLSIGTEGFLSLEAALSAAAGAPVAGSAARLGTAA
jgi:anti-anti-sigma factor